MRSPENVSAAVMDSSRDIHEISRTASLFQLSKRNGFSQFMDGARKAVTCACEEIQRIILSEKSIKNQYHNAFIIILAMGLLVSISGCGGGGGGSAGSPAPGGLAATPGDYALITRASASVGSTPVSIAYGAAYLRAALPSEQKVTLTERFYTAHRPSGAIGPIFDIQPDGLPFLEGTRICIKISDDNYTGEDLTIVTGAALNQPVAGSSGSGNEVCAPLTHSSPYSLARVRKLSAPEYTVFGSLDAKELYKYKVTSRTEDHSQWGQMFFVRIEVYCDFQCMESGEREFSFMMGKQDDHGFFDPMPDDLFIWDNGTYPLWKDVSGMPWVNLTNSDGEVVGGIAYLLAAEYVKYFLGGSGQMDDYISRLDPPEIKIQRFIYNGNATKQEGFIEIIKNETESPGVIKVFSRDAMNVEKTYLIDRETAGVTKKWIDHSEGAEKTLSLSPGDSGYEVLNAEVLNYVYTIVGIHDTPDETKGDAWDKIPRMLPVQELFAVNVMNLLRGYGWQNLVEIETYYRDRLKTWKNDQL